MPPPAKQRSLPFVAELAEAINKLPKNPEKTIMGGRAWDCLETRHVAIMGPYVEGTVMESLVAFVKDIWLVKSMLHHCYAGKKVFSLMVSIFVKTFEESWRNWGAARFRPLGLPSTHGTFYVEVVEAVLKARSTFAITKQLYGQYIGFHSLLVHIASLGRDDLMPGRIVAFGVGGFIKENVARQMEVLYSIPGTVTKESLGEAYLGKSTVKARLDAINKFHGIEDMSEAEWKAWWDRHQACEEPHQLEQQMGAIVLRGSPVIPATDGAKVDDDMEVDMPPYEGQISTSDEEEEVDEA